MKKIVILIIMLFLVTGCAVKYNVTINEDLSIIEEAKLTGTTDFFANYYKTTKTNVLKSFIEIYQDILDENNYQYELKEEETPYVLVNRKYDTINNYINGSILFNEYFDEIKYTEDGKIKKLETIGFRPNDPDNADRFNVKSLEIYITCPYDVKNHNAKKVDKQTNTFYYELNEENNKILFEFDSESKFNPNADLIMIIIIGVLIIVGCWIVLIYLNKKNNKNK